MMMIKVCIIVTICRHFPPPPACVVQPGAAYLILVVIWMHTYSSKHLENCWNVQDPYCTASLNSTFPKMSRIKVSSCYFMLFAHTAAAAAAAMMRGGKNTFQKYRSIKSMTGGGRRGALAVRSGFLLFEWDCRAPTVYWNLASATADDEWISSCRHRTAAEKTSLFSFFFTVGETAAVVHLSSARVNDLCCAARKERKRRETYE